MNKLVKIFAVLAMLTLLIMPALGAYVHDPKNDHPVIRNYRYVAPVVKLDVQWTPSLSGDPVEPVYVKATDNTDENGGKAVKWKKWYVDGRLVSVDPNVKEWKTKFVNNGLYSYQTHWITLIVANPANAKNPSEISWVVDVFNPDPREAIGEVWYSSGQPNPRMVKSNRGQI